MIKIEKTNREFDLLRWVLLAKAKDTSRYAINGVLFADDDTNTAVCTDGKRLHRAKFSFMVLEPGLYEVVTNTAKVIVLEPMSDEFTFPKYTDIIPVSDLATLAGQDDVKQYRKICTTGKLYRILKINLEDDFILPLHFLFDLLEIKRVSDACYEGDTFDVIMATSNKPFQFTRDDKTCVIMPIRVP